MAAMIYQEALEGSPENAGVPPALARLMVAWSAYETGGFTSSLYRNYNNLYGYTYAGQSRAYRATKQPDGTQYYAGYLDPVYSVWEIVNYIYRRVRDSGWSLSMSTPEQLATALSRAGYMGQNAGIYAQGVRQYWEDLNIEETPGNGLNLGALLIVVGIGVKLLKRA